MFFRVKKVKGYEYLQIVESKREPGGKVRQQVLFTAGNLAELQKKGQVEALAESLARFCDNLAVINAHRAGQSKPVCCKRSGPDLIFSRLWSELGLDRIVHDLAQDRRFKFAAERAVFHTVVHRLFESGSDRSSLVWERDFVLPGTECLGLQHLYRAMGFLGTPLKDQSGAVSFAPRCVKDLIEEQAFARRRDLFTNLSMVFFDTTSIYFEGNGGSTLGKRGHSKDHRPDLKQMVVGVVLDDNGIPLCCEMWPGNTADVTTISEVVKRFQGCFNIKDVCIVADRGMISAKMLEFLESPECTFRYILGVRLRAVKEVRRDVLSRAGRYSEVEPACSRHEPLKVKEVIHNQRRYAVCLNEAQARKDAHDREQIVASLREKLKSGDKSLVGNDGYRKYLKTAGKGHFAVDEAKLQEEERFDGKWVLTSNTSLSAVEMALQYKCLWMVEATFRTMKSGLDTRPVFHQLDRTIRGHVFCSFLAILLRRELERRLAVKGHHFEWNDILHDLAALEEVTAELSGKRVIFRSEMRGCASKVFQAVGVAIPPTLRFA